MDECKPLNAGVVKTASAVSSAKLTSALPDQAYEELKNIKMSSLTGATAGAYTRSR